MLEISLVYELSTLTPRTEPNCLHKNKTSETDVAPWCRMEWIVLDNRAVRCSHLCKQGFIPPPPGRPDIMYVIEVVWSRGAEVSWYWHLSVNHLISWWNIQLKPGNYHSLNEVERLSIKRLDFFIPELGKGEGWVKKSAEALWKVSFRRRY